MPWWLFLSTILWDLHANIFLCMSPLVGLVEVTRRTGLHIPNRSCWSLDDRFGLIPKVIQSVMNFEGEQIRSPNDSGILQQYCNEVGHFLDIEWLRIWCPNSKRSFIFPHPNGDSTKFIKVVREEKIELAGNRIQRNSGPYLIISVGRWDSERKASTIDIRFVFPQRTNALLHQMIRASQIQLSGCGEIIRPSPIRLNIIKQSNFQHCSSVLIGRKAWTDVPIKP